MKEGVRGSGVPIRMRRALQGSLTGETNSTNTLGCEVTRQPCSTVKPVSFKRSCELIRASHAMQGAFGAV